MIINPVTDVNEDVGQTMSCITAYVNQTLERDAVFNFEFSEARSTARLGNDFSSTFPPITIPSGFVGNFRMCINTTILDDDVVENEERIVYNLVAVSDRDMVLFPMDSMYLIINIIDDDGKNPQKMFSM